MKKGIIAFAAAALSLATILISCHKEKTEGNKPTTPVVHNTGKVISSMDDLTDAQKQQLGDEAGNIANVSNYIITTIAASSISDKDLANLTEDNIQDYGIFDPVVLDEKLQSLNNSKRNIQTILGTQTCATCSYTTEERLSKITQLVQIYRADPTAYTNAQIDLQAQVDPPKMLDGPGCHFSFYVCLSLCAAATDGIGAAACVYLCACGYCDYKPTGC